MKQRQANLGRFSSKTILHGLACFAIAFIPIAATQTLMHKQCKDIQRPACLTSYEFGDPPCPLR